MDIFPVNTLNGLDWNLVKTPEYNTMVVKAASGREVRASMQTQPIWHFVLSYAYLKDGLGGINDLKTLMAFYLKQLGSGAAFLFQDPNDFQVTNQTIATGDGVTKTFQLFRTMGGGGFNFNEIIKDVTALTVKVGTTVTSVTLDSNGGITFATAPANGAVISATFQFFFRVRFEDDSMDFTNTMNQLWEATSVKFVTVR